MTGLWADGWFYISSAGLFVSGVLFFFLLGQYRAASEAADITESEQGTHTESAAAVAMVDPVFVASISPDNPAGVHLRDLKSELAELRQEVRALTQCVDDQLSAVAGREKVLIERLGELTHVVTSWKTVAAAVPDVPPPGSSPPSEEKPRRGPVWPV